MTVIIATLSLICLFIGFALFYYAVINYRAQRNACKYNPHELLSRESGIYVDQGMGFNENDELEADKKVPLGFLRGLIAK